MDDLSDKLMDLLSNRENIEKIKGLTNIINASTEDNKNEKNNSQNPADNLPQDKPENDIIPVDAIQTVMKLMPLLSSINKEDENTRLLFALRPHLSEKRRNKLDESMKMMQMFKILPLLKSQDIL